MCNKQMDTLIASYHIFLFFFSAIVSKSLAIEYLKTARHSKKQTNQIVIALNMLPAKKASRPFNRDRKATPPKQAELM